jgi:hypothetical protein
MIDEPKTIVLPDVSGKSNHIPVQLNWNDRVKGCKYLKFILPNGETAIIDKDHWRTIAFFIANEEEQQKMMDRRVVTVKHIIQHLGVKATKDIFKGENINITLDTAIPVAIQDSVLNEEITNTAIIK